MTLVRIIRDYDWPDPLRQTPGHTGKWGHIQFTESEAPRYDFVIIWDRLVTPVTLRCNRNCIWALMHEPPNKFFRRLHIGPTCINRIFTQDTSLIGERYTLSAPALPWHVDFDYDQLKSMLPPRKSHNLSWITSNKTNFAGHRKRLGFLDHIHNKLTFDLYGYGFRPLSNKWDGLAPYRYSFAIENFSNPWYWTEKISDCFLSWTMPIYYGCPRIMEYFPENSLILIDIDEPETSIETINKAIADKSFEKNFNAIQEARRLVLDKYQFFPMMSEYINEWIHNKTHSLQSEIITLSQRYSIDQEVKFWCQDYLDLFIKSLIRIARITKKKILHEY